MHLVSMIYYLLSDDHNRIGGVMISVLTLSGVDRSFEPRSGQTKDYKIDFNKHDINIFINDTWEKYTGHI